MYTKEEKIAIVHWHLSNNSLRQVRDLFSVHYPDRPIPSIGSIHNMIRKFNVDGCIVNFHKKRVKTCHVLTEEMQLNILCYAEENPITPLRIIAKEFNISKESVRRTLKKYKYKAYKFANHQRLYPEDKIKRTDFCETMFNLLNENQNILNRIVFTDECSFSLNGTVNSQNYRFVLKTYYSFSLSFLHYSRRYWSNTNDHVQNITHTQYNEKVNVWAGIIDSHLIGPFFIDGNLNATKFLDLLRTQILPHIQNLNLNVNDVWFQMDGAPPHSTRPITRFLNAIFQDRWIGRFGPITWPPRSPDLSPNDFFLWGYVSSKIYNNVEIETTEELKNRIVTACDQINPNFLRNTVGEFYDRLGFCLEREGGHFEHLL